MLTIEKVSTPTVEQIKLIRKGKLVLYINIRFDDNALQKLKDIMKMVSPTAPTSDVFLVCSLTRRDRFFKYWSERDVWYGDENQPFNLPYIILES